VKIGVSGIVICALAGLVIAASAWASKPTIGLPPKTGPYKITGESSGSLAVRSRGSNYFVEHIRLLVHRPENECGQYQGQTATIMGGPIKLTKHVAHRVSENEVGYRVPPIKHFPTRQHGNVRVSIGGQTVVGDLNLGFSRGFGGAFKPVEGGLELAGVVGAPFGKPTCILIFAGHPR